MFGGVFAQPGFTWLKKFFWLHQLACGIERMPPALRAQSLNHWTTRGFPEGCFHGISLGFKVAMQPPARGHRGMERGEARTSFP